MKSVYAECANGYWFSSYHGLVTLVVEVTLLMGPVFIYSFKKFFKNLD